MPFFFGARDGGRGFGPAGGRDRRGVTGAGGGGAPGAGPGALLRSARAR
jgi:hypothetical protein